MPGVQDGERSDPSSYRVRLGRCYCVLFGVWYAVGLCVVRCVDVIVCCCVCVMCVCCVVCVLCCVWFVIVGV
jgi:hypothetical protein